MQTMSQGISTKHQHLKRSHSIWIWRNEQCNPQFLLQQNRKKQHQQQTLCNFVMVNCMQNVIGWNETISNFSDELGNWNNRYEFIYTSNENEFNSLQFTISFQINLNKNKTIINLAFHFIFFFSFLLICVHFAYTKNFPSTLVGAYANTTTTNAIAKWEI